MVVHRIEIVASTVLRDDGEARPVQIGCRKGAKTGRVHSDLSPQQQSNLGPYDCSSPFVRSFSIQTYVERFYASLTLLVMPLYELWSGSARHN